MDSELVVCPSSIWWSEKRKGHIDYTIKKIEVFISLPCIMIKLVVLPCLLLHLPNVKHSELIHLIDYRYVDQYDKENT